MGRFLIFVLSCLFFVSCGTSSKVVFFQSDRQDIQLFVNEKLIGYGQGSYTTEPGEHYLHLSCREDGIEVFTKEYNLRATSATYFEVSIPQKLYYGPTGPISPR